MTDVFKVLSGTPVEAVAIVLLLGLLAVQKEPRLPRNFN